MCIGIFCDRFDIDLRMYCSFGLAVSFLLMIFHATSLKRFAPLAALEPVLLIIGLYAIISQSIWSTHINENCKCCWWSNVEAHRSTNENCKLCWFSIFFLAFVMALALIFTIFISSVINQIILVSFFLCLFAVMNLGSLFCLSSINPSYMRLVQLIILSLGVSCVINEIYPHHCIWPRAL